LLFSYGEHLGQTCGHVHIVSPPAFVVMSSFCFKLLYIVWTRILLAYTSVLVLCPCSAAQDDVFDREGFECVDQPEAEVSSCPAEAADEVLPWSATSSSSSSMCEAGSGSWLPASSWRGLPSGRGRIFELRTCLAREPEVQGPLCGLVARCLAPFGRRASLRLVEPLRAHKLRSALSALGFLGALTLVRIWCGSYMAFAGELNACWGGLLGSDAAAAPVWLSEFGTDDNGLYWAYLLRYMKGREMDFAYWSINGEKTYNESETYGLLERDSVTVRHGWKLRTLQGLIIQRPQ